MQRARTPGQRDVNWRTIMHDHENVPHDHRLMRDLAAQGAAHGVITNIMHFRPRHMPDFLSRSTPT